MTSVVAIAGATCEGCEHCSGAGAIVGSHIDEAIAPSSIDEIYAECSTFATIHDEHAHG